MKRGLAVMVSAFLTLFLACESQVIVQRGPASEGPDPTDPTAEEPTEVEEEVEGEGDAGEGEGEGEGEGDTGESAGEGEGEPPPPPPPPPPPDPTEQCPRVRVDVAAGNTLNVRPEPNTSGAPVATLQDGALATTVDVVDGQDVSGISTWYAVDVGGVVGFVSGAFATCTFDEPSAVTDGFLIPLACGTTVRIAQGNFGGFSHSGRSRYAYDFSIPVGTPMMAMERGVVAATHDSTGPGDPCFNGGGEECFRFANYVELRHPDGSASIYKHLNRADVSVGDTVARGDQIGLSGSTGYSTGPHAHVMRQQDCGGDGLSCESMPLVFGDVEGDGVPERDDYVTSGNCQ